jgi:DNA-binding response OmpR family regulator
MSNARILVYSDDHAVRESVKLALGTKVAADLPEIEIVEAATPWAVLKELDAQTIDLAILDGEAVPEGGMGLAHQLKDEVPDCPPILLLVVRVADGWLATWSKAEAIATYPVDPIRLPVQVADLLRKRLSQAAADGEAAVEGAASGEPAVKDEADKPADEDADKPGKDGADKPAEDGEAVEHAAAEAAEAAAAEDGAAQTADGGDSAKDGAKAEPEDSEGEPKAEARA